MKYRYALSSTGGSSHKYGNCEVCGKHATEIFVQTEYKRYEFEHNGWKYEGWRLVDMVFGHEECLKKIRKGGMEDVQSSNPG
ncbi:hypothetical protein Calhy_0755 [Caldicellulosiruptor hydrothermalis 108]|uniref:Uncharacterized protein n=1 Tax=Caldicellulosiruptor hydrothermalis (strain DSM 18901 / VKM B-2411 / 108) TaxID=632292 RepID=E4QDS5_CALH1|nr:hypothetical protein [Caldicellulosiruptor hydrothermalis]ADQ06492.1 hypothetical protein Calhy_0755 [Caldicellulosiruptor hydrothermalis 108]